MKVQTWIPGLSRLSIGFTVIKSEGKNLSVLTASITSPEIQSVKKTSHLPDSHAKLDYLPCQKVEITFSLILNRVPTSQEHGVIYDVTSNL